MDNSRGIYAVKNSNKGSKMNKLFLVVIAVLLSTSAANAQFDNPFTKSWSNSGNCNTTCSDMGQSGIGTNCKTTCN